MDIKGNLNVFAHVNGEGEKARVDLTGTISHKDKSGSYQNLNVRVRLAGDLKGKEANFKEGKLYPIEIVEGFLTFEKWQDKQNNERITIIFVIMKANIIKEGIKDVKVIEKPKTKAPVKKVKASDDDLPF